MENKVKLLVLKSGPHYIRIHEDDYQTCSMEKATVFPLERIEEAKIHAQRLREKGFRDVAVYRLVIQEERITQGLHEPSLPQDDSNRR